jgi:superoxide reductase
MLLLEENTIDAAVEKHVPVIEPIEGGYKVIVGEVNHPMIEKHYIEWIELLADNQVFRRNLKPEEAPEAIFYTNATDVVARGYCNLHGNWRSN